MSTTASRLFIAVLSGLIVSAFACRPATAQEQPTHVCALYPYMYHGSYISYYAMKRYATMPYCRDPFSLNSVNPLTPGVCDDGTNCIAFDNYRKRTPDENLKYRAGKVGPPHKVRLAPGATIIGNGVGIVEFRKDLAEGGFALLKAQVYHVRLDPSQFIPPRSEGVVDFFIGHEVQGPMIVADRRYIQDPIPPQINEVETFPVEGTDDEVMLRVRIRDGVTHDYQVVLRTP